MIKIDGLTSKERYKKVVERSKGQCEVCGSNQGIELHHILSGSGRRRQQERYETIIALCFECHRGTYGVHGRDGHKLDLKLKRRLQEEYYRQGYKENEVRELMGGKLY